MVTSTTETGNATFYFIGVTTGQSSAQRVFPQWMAALGRPDVQLKGVDCQIHDDPARYRQIVAEIKADPQALGALITTHKVDLLDAARDLIDRLGHHAQLCDEVSCLAKRDGLLWGYVVDPVADGRALDAILSARYFASTQGELLSFGAGGAAVAVALHLLEKPNGADRPARFTFVDIDRNRLTRVETLLAGINAPIEFQYLCHQRAAENDRLLAQMPPGTVVINATGMGKDRPGSPITAAAQFPHNGVAWELNYRGELAFLQQALAQRETRQLTVADGWTAFLHGWTGVIAKVLDIKIDQATFDRLAVIAASLR